jgi:hypothetical protein
MGPVEILMVFCRRTLQRFLRLMKLQPALLTSSQKEMRLVKMKPWQEKGCTWGELQISVCIF